MSNKHTPGPWKQREDAPLDICGGFRDSRLAYVVSTRPNNRDDARLIAAAPDLLAACELAIATQSHESMIPAWNVLRAAIAKAKGETT